MVNTEFLNKTILVPPPLQNGSSLRLGESITCYYSTLRTKDGVWQDYNPLQRALPGFIVQLIIITAFTQFFILLLKPKGQPLIVSEIWAGILLGTTGLLRFKQQSDFLQAIFSVSRMMLLETVGQLGLIYTVFLIGLEVNLTTILRVNKKSFIFATVGALVSFVTGVGLYFWCVPDSSNYKLGSLFWGVSLSVTGLPVVADILADLKLIRLDFGRTAMASALINSLLSWIFLLITFTFMSSGKSAMWSLTTTTIFIIFCFYVIQPFILWVIEETSKGENYSEATISIILAGVLLCGLVTDLLGTTSLVGAFVFGLIIPTDVLGQRFLVVIQGFVDDILMPVYFMLNGVRMNIDALFEGPTNLLKVLVAICISCLSKFVTTFVVSYFFGMPLREGISLGVLTNSKGLLAIVSINTAYNATAMDDTGFAIMLIAIVIMTMVTAPAMTYLYKPSKRFFSSKRRALEKLKPDVELRIIVCVHQVQTVAGIINLLKASNATKRTPISVFALQLVEFTKNTTNLLVLDQLARSDFFGSQSKANAQNEQIIEAFSKLDKQSAGFTVKPSMVLSAYATMHEDICSIAEDKRAALIILPFHKRQTIHNKMEDTNPAYKDVNDNVLANAPCSVGIMLDRGIGMLMQIEYGENGEKCHIAMIYIGGPDDREALAYAWRMGGHPNTTLTVVRILPGENATLDQEPMESGEETHGILLELLNTESQKHLDDNFIKRFKSKTEGEESIVYTEKVSNNGSETVQIIKSMGEHFDLFVVGRGLEISSPLTAGLADWSECPEVGAIGDLLVTSEFSLTSSVLVVQQFIGLRATRDGSVTPDSADDYTVSYSRTSGIDDRTSV